MKYIKNKFKGKSKTANNDNPKEETPKSKTTPKSKKNADSKKEMTFQFMDDEEEETTETTEVLEKSDEKNKSGSKKKIFSRLMSLKK